MIYLFENDSQDKLKKVEKGDQIRIVTDKQELEYSTVVGVTGSQIEIINNGKPFIIIMHSAIDGNVFSYTNKDNKWFNMKFKRIDVKNAKTGKMFHIWPVDEAGQEQAGQGTGEALDPEFQELIKTSLAQFKQEAQGLEVGDKLYLGYGEWEFDENGNFTERLKQKTDTQLLFTISERKSKIIRMTLTGVDGVDNTMEQFRGRSFSMEISQNLFQYDKGGVYINILTPRGAAPLKYVYLFDKTKPSEQEENVAQETKASRMKFHNIIVNLQKGDTLKVKFGEMAIGPNGLPTFDIHEETETIATFEKMGDIKGHIYAKLLEVDGPMADEFKQYEDEYVYFSIDDKLFTYNDTGVILNVQHIDEKLQFKYVFYVDSDTHDNDDDDIDDEPEKESRISRLAKDKDLMRLMQTKTWRDRLMGRDGVGINPVKDIEKRLGLDRRSKGYIQLRVLDRDIIVGRGTNLHIKKGKEITGKFLNSDRIIIKSKNGKEEIQLFLTKTKKQDIYHVRITHVDSNGEKNKYGKATIEILS